MRPTTSSPDRTLYQQLLGPAFATLPVPMQRLHDDRPRKTLSGQASVARGEHWLARLAGAITSLPPASARVPVRVTIERDGDRERWRREFGAHLMASLQSIDGVWLLERLGLVTFRFELTVCDAQIVWRAVSTRVFGIALPRKWFDQVTAREGADGDRYTFDIRASLPGAGFLIRYHGWLDVQ